MRPDGSNRICLTDTRGGFFNPVWTANSDSLTAICFENPKQVSAYTIPAHRFLRYPIGGLKPVWASAQPHNIRNFNIPEQTSGIQSAPYRSLAHIRPMLTLPFMGSDDGGLQLGLIHYAADPLNKHQVLGYVTARKRIDWHVMYTNAQYLPLISIAAWKTTSNQGTFLGSKSNLWERKKGFQVEGTLPLYIGESLLSRRQINIWAKAEKIAPLNSDQYLVFKPAFRPFTGWINSIGAGYSWIWAKPDAAYGLHPLTGSRFSVYTSLADQWLGSNIHRARLSVSSVFRQEMPWARHVAAARVSVFYQWGEQPVQERLGLSSPGTIRGLSASNEGDRLFYGSVEYRIPGGELGIRLPVFYFEKWASAFWVDWGKAWGRDLFTYGTGIKNDFNEVKWCVTAGVEFRCRVILLGLLPVVVRGGMGWDPEARKNNWYFLIGNVF